LPPHAGPLSFAIGGVRGLLDYWRNIAFMLISRIRDTISVATSKVFWKQTTQHGVPYDHPNLAWRDPRSQK
jgi:hypothetical protein